MRSATVWILLFWFGLAHAGGGPLGIDHRLGVDNNGIWARHNQRLLEDLTLGVTVGGALWEGGEDQLGQTYWRTIDSSVLALVSAEALKNVFTRARPSQTSDPNQWFKGRGHYSFPSEEVAYVSAAITPFVVTYGKEHPAVLALEILPAYLAVARVKTGSHWQTDVLGGFGLGVATGYYAYKRDTPFILNALPGGFMIGINRKF